MRFETKATPTLTGLPLRTTLRSDPIEPRERPAGSHRPRRRNRGLLLIGLLSLSLLGEILGCGGGGGGGSPFATGPLQAWPRWRRNDINSGVTNASVRANSGTATLLYDFDDMTPSSSTPALARDGIIYLGTNEGLLALDSDGSERWFVDECEQSGRPFRYLSSPSIGPNGLDIIIASANSDAADDGGIFLLRESLEEGIPPQCVFDFPSGSRSAAIVSVDGADLELLSLVIGTQAGRLLSLNRSGRRRWSFPEQVPFSGDLSSSPALAVGGFAFVAPDGQLHSVDLSGRPRWSARIGDPFGGDELIPSPVVFDGIFTVSNAGDIVAFSSSGTRLWTFTPDAPVAGSLAVSPLTTAGGVFIGENTLFALDQQGTLYAIGTGSGELLRFCETENRACRPDSCPDGDECVSKMRCSTTTSLSCTEADDEPCPMGESCITQLRCDKSDSPCTQDQCITSDTAGRCTREAKHPMTGVQATFRTSPVLSIDAFIVAATTDGRVCARHPDGSVPAGTCDPSGMVCTPDSCVAPDDSCCGAGDDGCVRGRCKVQTEQRCTANTCPDDEACVTDWLDGCIGLGDDVGTTTFSSPVIDSTGGIFVTTEKGLAAVR